MPIDENKPATSLIINSDQLSNAELQNRLGTKHDIIKNLTPGKFLTIIAVETDAMVAGEAYSMLENVLKNDFGVQAMQMVFDVAIPDSPEQSQQFNVYITGHLRVVNAESD